MTTKAGVDVALFWFPFVSGFIPKFLIMWEASRGGSSLAQSPTASVLLLLVMGVRRANENWNTKKSPVAMSIAMVSRLALSAVR